MRLSRQLSVALPLLLLAIGMLLVFWKLGSAPRPKTVPVRSASIRKVIESAMEQTRVTTSYDASYVNIPYPGGDVPADTGVCSDVVIRAFRAAGVDLQVKVHEDMKRNFAKYPHQWGLRRPDTSIDHRRVPNLMTYFKRQGKALPITEEPSDYLPGDVVSWDFGGARTHVGLVSNTKDPKTGRFLIIHNSGRGTRLEDRLFRWPVIGHYRYFRWE